MPKLRFAAGALALAAALTVAVAPNADAAQTSLRAADPSVIRIGGTYISVQSAGGGIAVRQAASTDALAAATPRQVWSDTRGRGEVWAPEIVTDGGRYYIYFSAGAGAAHRMYVISSATANSGYTAETQLALPDDKWAIDGTMFTFNGQRWFVWSGWAGDTNVEQNLYLARMSSPTTPTGARYIISQPRESWERVVGNPFINEAPTAIKDPNGQLHIVYSANGSWSDQYCLAEVRLRSGGDPDVRVGLVQVERLPVRLEPGHHDDRLGSDALRERARQPQLRAAQRRHRDQSAGRATVPADVPRGPQGHAVLVGEPLLVHRHVLLVGQHHLPAGQRARRNHRHGLRPQVLRVARKSRGLIPYA